MAKMAGTVLMTCESHVIYIFMERNAACSFYKNHLTRTVMLIKSGSLNDFDTLWNSAVAVNDPHGNKSQLYFFDESIDTDDFKVDIDPSWGNIQFLEIIGFNTLGEELCYALFDVEGKDISNVENWFVASDLLDTSPGISDLATVSTTARDGNKELLITTNSNEAWFSVVRLQPSNDLKIVLPVNSSSPLTGQLDSLPETADSALLLEVTHVGEYNFTINVTEKLLAQGWTDGYIFIDRISIDATVNDSIMLFSFEYLSDFSSTYIEYEDNGNIYFDTDGIPVNLQMLRVVGIRVLYEFYADGESVIKLYGPTANSYVDVPALVVIAHIGDTLNTTTPVSTTLIASSSTISWSGSTTSASTMTDIGSNTMTNAVTSTEIGSNTTTNAVTSTEIESYTTTNAVTSTEIGSNTTTNPVTATDPQTTSSPSVTSLYTVYPNLSISVNGTLYCPCSEIDNVTSPNLTSIYRDSNKSFEELIADLTLDAHTLASNKRKYISAMDNRPSAATLGTLGVILIVSALSFIVYMDSARLVQEAYKIRKNYKILKKRLSKRSLKVECINVKCKDDGQEIPDILK